MNNLCVFFLLIATTAFGQETNLDSLKRLLTNVERQANSSENQKQKATILNQIGYRLISSGQFDFGLAYSQKAFELAKKNNFYSQMAQSQFNIGFVVQKKERFFEAISYFETAQKFAKKANNDSLLSQSYHYAGMCYNDQELPQKSIEALLKELKIDLRANLKLHTIECYNSLGLAYTKLNRPDSAYYYFERIIQHRNQFEDNFMTGVAYKNLGRILLMNNRDDEGIELLKKSIAKIFQSKHFYQRNEVHYAYVVLAQYYHQKKQYRLSNNYGRLSWHLVDVLNYTDQKIETSKILYDNYKAIGRQDSALFFLEKYAESSLKINQDLLNEQHIAADARLINEKQKNQILALNQEKIVEAYKRKWLLVGLTITLVLMSAIGVLYQTIKKQKTLIEDANQTLEDKVQLRTTELKNALLEIKEAMMKGQKLERKRVASDLHDNLGSLLSAISIGMETIDETEMSEKERQVFRNIQLQIGSAYNEVRLLSHNLQPDELEKEGLKKALETVTNKINQHQKIKIKLDTTNIVPFSKEIEFALYSITLELINNTLKFAFASELSITFDQLTAHKWQMQVSDNGRGLHKDHKEGFGLRSIKNRIEAIGGTIQTISEGGLAYLIYFET